MKRCLSPVWLGLLLGVAGAPLPVSAEVRAADPESASSRPAPVSFHRHVRPLLQAHCAGCHQPAKAKGGFIATTAADLFRAGDSERLPVVSGRPNDSHLVAQITPVDGQAEMPPGKAPLSVDEIDIVRRWIAEGAADDSPPRQGAIYDATHPPQYSRPPVISSLDFSPDGRWLAVAGFHEVLLHRSDGSGIEARLIGLSERIQSVRFSPDGKSLAVAGGQPGRFGEIQIWDVEPRSLRVSVSVGYDTVYGVHWSPDGRLVSFGCPDKTVRVIEAATGRQVLQQMVHEDWVLDTVFSTNGSHVISVGRDMTAKLTEVATQRFIDNITSITPGALRGGLQSVARHPARDEILVGGADGQPQIFQVFRQAARKIGDNATLLRRFPEIPGRIFGVDYSPDGNRIAAGASLDAQGAVHVYTARFDPVIPSVLLKAYEKTSGEYTKEERDAIQQFTTADIGILHTIDVPTAPVFAVDFSPDGRRLAAGTGTGVILLFDTESGELLMCLAAAPFPASSPARTEVAAVPPNQVPADASAPKSTEPSVDVLPPGARVSSLSVQPDRILLTRRNDRVQLLVSALLSSGETIDVSGVASYALGNPSRALVTVSPQGAVSIPAAPAHRPPDSLQAHDTVRIQFENQSVVVPVELRLAHDRFAADFVQDVNPVLAELGCSAGTCHGAREGKNGFKLSLRGYDALFDVRSLTDDHAARRVNLASPDDSLMLLKATGTVPHEGGLRTTPDSPEYAILRQWIAEGARLDRQSPKAVRIDVLPSNPVVQRIGARQQIRVLAAFPDGTVRDVTGDAVVESGNLDVATAAPGGVVTTLRRGEAPILARYEGNYAATTITVMGDRSGFEWTDPPLHNRIDELVAAKWRRLKILPSDLCSDAEFIRRVSLDLTGLPPTAAEVRDFLANPRDRRSKRDALIERLLGSEAFIDHWANKWADLLQVNRKFLGEEGAHLFRDWIRAEVAGNTPYDEFVRRILTAKGSNRTQPAAAYWKILREPTEAMENTTHLFLATRFNCNKCHDHPFERWTQDQYYELSQFFAQVQLDRDEASGDRRIGGTAVEGAKPLFETVSDRSEGGVKHDRTGRLVPPAFPYSVAATPTPVKAEAVPSRRAELAAWLTSPDNRYFALSFVNRLWGYLLGVGLIEPIDDIRAGNPPSNPELLDHLTREFIESGFNPRHILRRICQSRTYQLSIDTHRWNEDDRVNYSHALPRRLPAEVLLDSVYRATGSTPAFPGAQPGTRAAQLLDSGLDLPSGFLANLGRPPRESACECERTSDIKLSSVMALLSGPAVADAVHDPENAIADLASRLSDDRALAEELFLRILNRPPLPGELDAVAHHSGSLDDEHARLTSALSAAESAWAERLPGLHRHRAEAVARAERALADYLTERAPKTAAAQRERLDGIAAAEAAVAEREAHLDALMERWESDLSAEAPATAWSILQPREVQVGGSARLQKLPDGSIRSTASVGELPTYVVTAESTTAGITGVKLEVLPDASLPAFGPGHHEGDFMLAEFTLETAPKTNAQAFSRAKWVASATDVVSDTLNIAQTYNGIAEQGRPEGWSIAGQTGRPHWATFALESPTGDTNGIVLRFTLAHRFQAPHEIGRFRLWITTSASPTHEGLPADLIPILKVPAQRRTADQLARLRSHVRAESPDLLRHDFQLELARKPLPADERLAELERDLVRASRPVPTDPALVQLRRDVELSAAQLARRRLTAAQDLSWALINSPSFLFNH